MSSSRENQVSKNAIPAISTPEGRKDLVEAIIKNESTEQGLLAVNKEIREEERVTDISTLILQGKLVDAISALRLLKDKDQNIQSQYFFYDEDKVLFRDATLQEDQKDTYHDWAIMGINYGIAAKNLFEAHDLSIENFKDDLNSLIEKFVNGIKSSSDPEVSLGLFIHNDLLPLLIEHTPVDNKTNKKILTKEQIKKQLAEVRDFGNFEHDAMTVVTKITVDSHQLFQFDMPLVGGMSEKLKQDYKNLAELSENDPALAQIRWYANQQPHVKKLIRKYAKRILEEKVIIPTQLRKYFPGIRNGGEEILVCTDDNKKPEIIQRHYHSGTPGHFLGKESQNATNESIKQLGNVTDAQNVLVLTLLSPRLGYFGDDGNLVRQVRNAVKKANAVENKTTTFHTSNVPLNFIRGLFSFTELSGADWLLKQAEAEEKPAAADSKAYDNLQALIKEYKQVRRFWNWNPFYDPENRYLQLASVIKRLGHAVNEVHRANHPEEQRDFVAVASSCQSGKDRAGLTRIRALIDSIKNYFKGINNEAAENPIIHSGQVQAQAGFQGGTIGAHGLKNDTKGANPASWEKWVNILFKKTASYNKGLPEDPRKAKGYKKNKASLEGIANIQRDTHPASSTGSMLSSNKLGASGVKSSSVPDLKRKEEEKAAVKMLNTPAALFSYDELKQCIPFLSNEDIASKFKNKASVLVPGERAKIINDLISHYPDSERKRHIQKIILELTPLPATPADVYQHQSPKHHS